MSQQTVESASMLDLERAHEWVAKLHALRALWVLVLEANRRSNAAYDVLLRLGEELSLCEVASAWADPNGPESEDDDPRIFWHRFDAIGPRIVDDGNGGMREYKGSMYGPGHPRAPERGVRGQWCIAAGVAVQGKRPFKDDDRDDGEPQNVPLGARIRVAWLEWTNLGAAANEAKKTYEVALRACVEETP